MELSDIFKQIDTMALEKQRRISKNNITVRLSDNDMDLIAAIKSIRNVKTSSVIKESLSFYCATLQNKNNN